MQATDYHTRSLDKGIDVHPRCLNLLFTDMHHITMPQDRSCSTFYYCSSSVNSKPKQQSIHFGSNKQKGCRTLSPLKAPTLITLPPEILNIILTYVSPLAITTSPHYSTFINSYASLNALSRTCRYFHPITTPLLFRTFIRRTGDDISLLYFVRALINNPKLVGGVGSVQIDDCGYIFPPPSASKCFLPPRVADSWEYFNGNTCRPITPMERQGVPGWQRVVNMEHRRGNLFIGKDTGMGGPEQIEWPNMPGGLGEDDWLGLLRDSEWETLEKKVYEICARSEFSSPKGQDRDLSAREWGERGAANFSGMRWRDEDRRIGQLGIECESDEDELEWSPANVVSKFDLRCIDRSDEEWANDRDFREYRGWRLTEKPPKETNDTPPILARRWLRALRRGSKDAWCALLIVLCPNVQCLRATTCNWGLRCDPSGQFEHDEEMSAEQEEELGERNAEEDAEWQALGGFTWVGRVLWQCAAGQSFTRATGELTRERYYEAVAAAKASSESESEPPKKRRRIEAPPRWRPPLPNIPPPLFPYPGPFLPHLTSISLGSSSNPAHHPNLSPNTVLHFLQPPLITHATIYGLSGSTFGIHERKPPSRSGLRFGIKHLNLYNCDAKNKLLGYLLSMMPELHTLVFRSPWREINGKAWLTQYNPKDGNVPGMRPQKLVAYLSRYCKDLRTLDLDMGNEYGQHCFDGNGWDCVVDSLRGLRKLEVLKVRVEHLVGNNVENEGNMVLVDGHWAPPSPSEKDSSEEAEWRQRLSTVFPESLKELIIGVDNEEYERVLEPLCVWVEGLKKRTRAEGGEGTKLESVMIRCGNVDVKERIAREGPFWRLCRACNSRGIRPGLGLQKGP